MLGGGGDLKWRIEGDRLLVQAPAEKPASKRAYALAIDRAAGN